MKKIVMSVVTVFFLLGGCVSTAPEPSLPIVSQEAYTNLKLQPSKISEIPVMVKDGLYYQTIVSDGIMVRAAFIFESRMFVVGIVNNSPNVLHLRRSNITLQTLVGSDWVDVPLDNTTTTNHLGVLKRFTDNDTLSGKSHAGAVYTGWSPEFKRLKDMGVRYRLNVSFDDYMFSFLYDRIEMPISYF